MRKQFASLTLFVATALFTLGYVAVAGSDPISGARSQRTLAVPKVASDRMPVAQGTLTPAAYLPLLFRHAFPPYSYHDDFEDWESGWPWGVIKYYKEDRSAEFYYGYKHATTTNDVYHIRILDRADHVWLTAPEYALGDFEYQVDLCRASTELPLRWGDQYGILISPTRIDLSDPRGENVYTLQVRLKVAGDYPPSYVVQRWSIEGQHTHSTDTLADEQEPEYLTDEAKVWNRLRITRTENTLDFYVTTLDDPDDAASWKAWKHVYSVPASDLPQKIYVGLFAAHVKGYDYPIEFHYDNVHFDAHP